MATKTKLEETVISTTGRRPAKEGEAQLPDKKDGARENTPRLPHEHDESSDSQQSESRTVIRQAYDDIQEGQLDTDRRGIPGVEEVERQRPHHKQPDIPDSSRTPPSVPKK